MKGECSFCNCNTARYISKHKEGTCQSNICIGDSKTEGNKISYNDIQMPKKSHRTISQYAMLQLLTIIILCKQVPISIAKGIIKFYYFLEMVANYQIDELSLPGSSRTESRK